MPIPLLFGGKCCMTIAQTQQAYGNLFVRSVSVVVDQGVKPEARANYKVELYDASVNGTHANRDLRKVDIEGFQTVQSKDLPTSGVTLGDHQGLG